MIRVGNVINNVYVVDKTLGIAVVWVVELNDVFMG